jgi:hypothetical protein
MSKKKFIFRFEAYRSATEQQMFVHTNNVLQLVNVLKKRSSRIKLRNIVRKYCSLPLLGLVCTQLQTYRLWPDLGTGFSLWRAS